MAIYVITFHMVAIVCMIGALIFGIVAASLGGMRVHNDAYKAFLIIGIVGIAVATLIEFLLKFIDSVRSNAVSHILALIFVIIGGVGFLVASAIIGSHSVLEMGLIATVLAVQAILIYLIQWKFSA